MWIRADLNDPLPAPKHKHGFLLKVDEIVEYATDVPFTKAEAEKTEILLAAIIDWMHRAYERDRQRRERKEIRQAAKKDERP